jgi:hypothetical protein
MSRRWRFLLACACVASATGGGAWAGYDPRDPEGPKTEIWQELEVEPPAFPQEANLKEFYVSPIATNKYFIDQSTLMPGTDGVVRYVLVVLTSGGAKNISFEGMNCKDQTWKHYATGRSDGVWTKSRAARNAWRDVENKPINPHHAALYRDFFCPARIPIQTADEGRKAFRLGRHPDATQSGR